MFDVKFQSFSFEEGLRREGNFQVGEIICGEMIFPQLPILLNLGMLKPHGEPNATITFKGRVHSVTLEGEATNFVILTEVNPLSDDPQAVRSGTTINLSDLESYKFSASTDFKTGEKC